MENYSALTIVCDLKQILSHAKEILNINIISKTESWCYTLQISHFHQDWVNKKETKGKSQNKEEIQKHM